MVRAIRIDNQILHSPRIHAAVLLIFMEFMVNSNLFCDADKYV
jgi:hypothetical protein